MLPFFIAWIFFFKWISDVVNKLFSMQQNKSKKGLVPLAFSVKLFICASCG